MFSMGLLLRSVKVCAAVVGVILSFGCSSVVFALTYQDAVDLRFTFEPTLSVNLSGDLVISTLAPGGAADSNIIDITVSSNNINGYTLYASVGNSTNNYTDLRLSPSNSTNKFTNLPSNKTTLAAFSDNTWGYSYSTDSGGTWVSGDSGSTSVGYNGLPLYNAVQDANDNTVDTGVRLVSTNSASIASLKFKIGAKAADTQAAGTYTNVVNFINVANIVNASYSLTYVGNDAANGTLPSPNPQIGTTTTGVFNLSATIPTKANFLFRGWCTTDNTVDPTACSGLIIEPGGAYVVGSVSGFTGSVWAVWRPVCNALGATIDAIVCMQDITNSNRSSILSSMVQNQKYQLYDLRDGNTYNVAKLADGNIWMVDNLLFTGTSLIGDSSNVAASYTAVSPYVITWYDLDGTEGSSATGHCYGNGDTGDGYNYLCMHEGVDGSGNPTVWYNYAAASAGTVTGSSDASVAIYSVCPAGWRLPMYSEQANITSQKTAFEPVYGGFYQNGTLNNSAINGTWWSATSYNASRRYYLFYWNDALNTGYYDQDFGSRYIGTYLRCVISP